jgi:hypothetical protein
MARSWRRSLAIASTRRTVSPRAGEQATIGSRTCLWLNAIRHISFGRPIFKGVAVPRRPKKATDVTLAAARRMSDKAQATTGMPP